mmetsp:Transcript_34886/g.81570  ORF Transcript_34886/g.81570 Transcript_34886/m.81570 type:complete len:865 (-) Transcript_34886:142-2736(-)
MSALDSTSNSSRQFATETAGHFLSEILSLHSSVAVEVSIVALIIVIYLWQTSSARRSSSKCGVAKAHNSRVVRSLSSSTDHAAQVQQLVLSLMGQCNSPSEILTRYDDLTRLQMVDLRQHIVDEVAARAFYVGLINCSLQQPSRLPRGQEPTSEAAVVAKGHRYWINRVLRDMRRSGFVRGTEFYSSVLKILTGMHCNVDALWLYDIMGQDGCLPDATAHICLLNAASACQDSTKALHFFTELRKTGSTSLKMDMAMVRLFSKGNDWQSAADLVLRRRETDPRPDVLLLNHVLGLCISCGALGAAEEIMKMYGELVDTVSCNILLKGYARQGASTASKVLMQRMKKEGPAPNLISFNTVMDCEVKAMRHETSPSTSGIWDCIDQLTAAGLEPDRYSCSTLLKGMHAAAACSPAEIDRTISILRMLGPLPFNAAEETCNNSSSSSQTPNLRLLEVVFNTLLDVCVTARDLDRLTDVFAMMQDFRVNISAVTLGTLIKAFGQAGRLSRCKEVWQHMWDVGIKPAVVTYGCFIDACVRNEDFAGAEEALRTMAREGLEPNVIIYTCLIKGFAQARLPVRALEVYTQMRKRGIQGTLLTYNSVLDALVRHSAPQEELKQVWEDMEAAGIEADAVTYSVFIKAHAAAGNVSGALELFRTMRARQLTCDDVTTNNLLVSCSRAERVQDAEEVFVAMQCSGVTPTTVTASILIKMYGRAKQLEKAIAIPAQLEKKYAVRPNLHVYTCLVQACVQNKQVKRSWEIFCQALKTGLLPDAILYGTVIHGCIYANKLEQAMSLVRHAYLEEQTGALCPWDTTMADIEGCSQRRAVVPLQSEVCQALANALRRREHKEFSRELADIMKRKSVLGQA